MGQPTTPRPFLVLRCKKPVMGDDAVPPSCAGAVLVADFETEDDAVAEARVLRENNPRFFYYGAQLLFRVDAARSASRVEKVRLEPEEPKRKTKPESEPEKVRPLLLLSSNKRALG